MITQEQFNALSKGAVHFLGLMLREFDAKEVMQTITKSVSDKSRDMLKIRYYLHQLENAGLVAGEYVCSGFNKKGMVRVRDTLSLFAECGTVYWPILPREDYGALCAGRPVEDKWPEGLESYVREPQLIGTSGRFAGLKRTAEEHASHNSSVIVHAINLSQVSELPRRYDKSKKHALFLENMCKADTATIEDMMGFMVEEVYDGKESFGAYGIFYFISDKNPIHMVMVDWSRGGEIVDKMNALEESNPGVSKFIRNLEQLFNVPEECCRRPEVYIK